jgi:hypothetical protein
MLKQDNDISLLMAAKAIRMFSYGMFSVVFIDHLISKKMLVDDISYIQSAIVAGDILLSFLIAKNKKLGTKNILIFCSILYSTTGLIYTISSNATILIASGVIGIMSLSDGDIRPFMPLEKSIISEILSKRNDKINCNNI